VTEFTATAGQTSFSVASYTVGFIDVYRNGVRLNSADYTATTGTTVVLTSGATSGDTVTTMSFLISTVLNAIPSTTGAVITSYILDANVTTAKIADANVTQIKLAAGVAGNGPAFSAYQSSAQTIGSVTFIKISLQTEEFDTNSCFNNTASTVGGIPSYSFLPTVAGYYQFTGSYAIASSATNGIISFWKNGSEFKRAAYLTASSVNSINGSCLIYCNGTTDYVSLYIYIDTGQNLSTGPAITYFQGSMVRSA
jgi:hypothetical protein